MKVYQAINKVQLALTKEGITKNRKNQQQGYNFRGIDDVYNALSPLLAEHGLCILPRMLSRTCEERTTAKGGIVFYVTVEAEFDFVSSEDGSKHIVRTFGEAMDSGDKATNKAMSAAYKYAAFQAFAIPTEGDNDADSHTHEVKPQSVKSVARSVWDDLPAEEQNFLTGVAMEIIAAVDAGNMAEAHRLFYVNNLDSEEQTALWSRFNSQQRAAIKSYKDAIERKAA
jgi:hypothetical protein